MKDHTRGAFEGLALGLIGGVASGALVGIISTYDDTNDSRWIGHKEEIASTVTAFGSIGACIGVLLGAQRGSQHIYYISHSGVTR